MTDLRDAVRGLAATPGFLVAAVISMAVAIGANTTIFSLVRAVLLEPLPIAEPARVMAVARTFTPQDAAASGAPPVLMPASFPNYQDLARDLREFTGLAAYTFGSLNVASGPEPVQVTAQYVTGEYFDVLGIRPQRGRFFRPGEADPRSSGPVAVLSDGFWRRQYGGEAGIVGAEIQINGRRITVIGVAPRGFTGLQTLFATELWLPVGLYRELVTGLQQTALDQRAFRFFQMVGRLAPGATADQAEAALAARAERLAEQHPDVNRGRGIRVMPVTDAALGPNQQGLFVRAGAIGMGAVAVVLLVACANVSNLMLVRARRKRRDHALRVALGASRWRLARLQLLESVLVATGGGLAGALLAFWGRDVIWSFRPPIMTNAVLDLSIDLPLAAFTAGVTLLTALLFGLAPMVQAIRGNVASALRTRQHDLPARRFDVRHALVALQVALCLVALAAAGAFIGSLRDARAIATGYDTERLLVMGFDAGGQGRGPAATRQFYDDLVERLNAVPGIDAAAVAQVGPLVGSPAFRMFADGVDLGPTGTYVSHNAVSTGYFETLGIPLAQGRVFDSHDRADGRRVIVVNRTLAARFWPGQSAVGRRLRIAPPINTELDVVGVVEDARYASLGEPPTPYFYLPMAQQFAGTVVLYARTSGDPATLLAPVRREVERLDATLPVTAGRTMRDVIDDSLWAPSLAASLLGLFGLVTAVLAATGTYAVIAQTVAQRRHEIGVRLALGARPSEMAAFVARKGLGPVAFGLVLGAAIAAAILPSMQTLLFGAASWMQTIVPSAALLAATALVACAIPARRAMRVDPLRSLRTE